MGDSEDRHADRRERHVIEPNPNGNGHCFSRSSTYPESDSHREENEGLHGPEEFEFGERSYSPSGIAPPHFFKFLRLCAGVSKFDSHRY